MNTNPPETSGNGLDELNDKLKAAGRPKVTDKRDSPEDETGEIVEYGCPYCSFRAPSERVVRAHITSSKDGKHADRNAFLDQIFVHGLDEDGNIVEDSQEEYSREERRNGEVTTEMFPDDLTEKQRQILEIAVQNPKLNDGEVAKRVAERYDEQVSQGYVNKTRRRKLKQAVEKAAIEPAEPEGRSYDELTDVQQTIIDEVIEFEEPLNPKSWPVTQTEVAERAGCDVSNIRPTLERYGQVALHRKAKEEAKAERTSRSSSASETKGAEDEDAGGEAESESTVEIETEQAPNTVPVERETLRAFATEIETLKRSTQAQQEAAPDDSAMETHAAGKLELIERCEDFLGNITTESESGDETDE